MLVSRLNRSIHACNLDFDWRGRAESVDNGVIRLADCREDEKEIAAADGYIEAAAFDGILQHVFREATGDQAEARPTAGCFS